MTGKLTIDIVTPEKRLVSTHADEAVIPGAQGLFGVRPGHTPFLSLVEPGTLTIVNGGQSQAFFVAGGFCEVGEDQVRVLADSAEPTNAIDVAATQKKIEAAKSKLTGMALDDPRFAAESEILRRETARLASATKRS